MSKTNQQRSSRIGKRYSDDQIRTGETFMECSITGDEYRVTKWAETNDGREIAIEKELVDDE